METFERDKLVIDFVKQQQYLVTGLVIGVARQLYIREYQSGHKTCVALMPALLSGITLITI